MISLVTGMKGFVGAHLARWLEQNGEEPICCDVDTTDITDAGQARRAVKEAKPDRVYHLAAESSAGKSWKEPDSIYNVNVQGTINVLKAVFEYAPESQMLMVSTSEIYGEVGEGEGPINEGHNCCPVNPYSMSKFHAEIECDFYRRVKNLDVRVVRPLGHTGPGQRIGFVVPDLASQVAAISLGKAEPKIKVGRLDVSREFADARDVVRAYWTIMEKGERGAIYNLATNEPHTIEEVAKTLIDIAGVEADIYQEQSRLRPIDISTPKLDTAKISALGFRFEKSFRDTLADALDEWTEKIKSGKHPDQP